MVERPSLPALRARSGLQGVTLSVSPPPHPNFTTIPKMLYGANKLTHFRCLGGWGRPSRFPLAVHNSPPASISGGSFRAPGERVLTPSRAHQFGGRKGGQRWQHSFWGEREPDHLSPTLGAYYLIGPSRLWRPPCFFLPGDGTLQGRLGEGACGGETGLQLLTHISLFLSLGLGLC